MDLSKVESIVTIVVTLITPLLTILTWLVTREKFVGFWKRWFKTILGTALVVSIFIFVWRIGWLNWLSNTVTWPIWGLVLFAIGVLLSPILIILLILLVSSKKETNNQPTKVERPNYFVIYGARWYLSKYENSFEHPPVCANCLMEMRNTSLPGYFDSTESWECRQCGHRIQWNRKENGDLLEDIAARYNAELRHKQETAKKQ